MASTSLLESVTVLVAADHAPLLRNLTFLLQVAGLNVLTANIGAEAFRLMKRKSPDLVLVDLDMADNDGVGLLRRIRQDKQRHGLPVIGISQKYALQDLMRALDLGVTDYLVKPFGVDEVLQVITDNLPQQTELQRVAG